MSENCPTCGRPYATGRLTRRQADLMRFVEAYVAENGFAPTYREIADHMGVRSLATVYEHVTHLRQAGYLQPAEWNTVRATLPLTSITED